VKGKGERYPFSLAKIFVVNSIVVTDSVNRPNSTYTRTYSRTCTHTYMYIHAHTCTCPHTRRTYHPHVVYNRHIHVMLTISRCNRRCTADKSRVLVTINVACDI